MVNNSPTDTKLSHQCLPPALRDEKGLDGYPHGGNAQLWTATIDRHTARAVVGAVDHAAGKLGAMCTVTDLK